MLQFPTTVWSAIRSIRHDPDQVKDLVVRRYRDPVYQFVRKQGLPHEDAEDVTQEVFLRVCQEDFLEKADRQKGKFRTYLLAVSKHVIGSYRRHALAGVRDRRKETVLDDLVIPIDPPSDMEFDRLWAKNLMTQAFERLGNDPNLKALALQMEGKSYQEISAELGRPIHDVTNHIHRAKRRLREEIKRLIAAYCNKESVADEVTVLTRML